MEASVSRIQNLAFRGSPKLGAQRRDVLLNFTSGFTGILHDWWQSLVEYHQLQFLQGTSTKDALIHLYVEFCGQEVQITETL